jgi:hypothetical protein
VVLILSLPVGGWNDSKPMTASLQIDQRHAAQTAPALNATDRAMLG